MCKNWCKLPCCGPSGRNMGLFILRVALGIIFVYSGAVKLQNIDMTAQFFSSVGIPLSGIMAPVVGALELLGGLMLIAGYHTVVAAHWLIVVMLVAIISTKLGKPFSAMWYADIAVLGGLFGIIASGSGTWMLLGKKSGCCGGESCANDGKDCCGGQCKDGSCEKK